MAEKYQAKHSDEIASQKTAKEERKEAGTKVAKTALKGLANYYSGGKAGFLVDKAANTKLGQKMLDNAGKTIARNPVAGQFAKKLDDMKVIDAVDKGMDYISPNDSAGKINGVDGLSANVLSNKSLLSNDGIDTNNAKNDANIVKNQFNFNPFKVGKTKLIIAGGLIFFIILLFVAVVGAKDFGNLDLTNKTESIIGVGSSLGSVVTKEQLESRLIYVGDSRMVMMESTLNNANISYIAEVSMGYSWLVNTASVQLDNLLQQKSNAVVVLALGVNDLYNINNYISYYNELIAKYPNNVFYILSVNPVEDSKASANGYSQTNSAIEEFNNQLKANFPDNYIDSYSNISVTTTDGIHYNSETDNSIHNYVVSSIISSGKVRGAGGDLVQKLEEVGLWYIANVNTYQQSPAGQKGTGARKYYQTPFGTRSFGDDCTEFVAAYMSYVSGVDIPESYSGGMVNPNDSWAQSVAQYGWKAYSSDSVGLLQSGDILIAHSGSLYSTKGYHGEVYISETQTFGWGSIKSAYPTNNSIEISNFGGHIHFMDRSHDYITVYRYEG